MAIMYPKGGPVNNASYTAEPTVYYALARQLSDDFVVIHSIPWLAQVAQEVAQVRRGIHGLAQWVFKASSISYRFGYGVVFPQSIVKGRSLPPSLIDMTSETPQSICLDQKDLSTMGTQVKQLMHYWQAALNNRPLSQHTINTIVKLLLPDPDFTPSWVERFERTKQKYLQLTSQQSMRLQQIEKHPRFVLTGRSGTGKTLLAIEYARRLVVQGKRVLLPRINLVEPVNMKKENAGTRRCLTEHFMTPSRKT